MGVLARFRLGSILSIRQVVFWRLCTMQKLTVTVLVIGLWSWRLEFRCSTTK